MKKNLFQVEGFFLNSYLRVPKYTESFRVRITLCFRFDYRLDVDAVVKRLEEENVDDPEHNQGTSEDNEETNPVPQVKVAPDGSIIIDEASTLIETTAAKKAKEDLLKSPLVFESANNVSLRTFYFISIDACLVNIFYCA